MLSAITKDTVKICKKTAPLFLSFEGQMHRYPSVYSCLYATVLLKQFLLSVYAQFLQNIRF